MPTTQESKVPPEKPGSGAAGTEKDSGTDATGNTAGGAKGGVKPQDDDRPPQN
jgi:hypothetical protein